MCVLTFCLIGVQNYCSLSAKFIANVHLLMPIYNEVLRISSLKTAFHTDRWHMWHLKRCRVVTASVQFIVCEAVSTTYALCCNYRTMAFVLWKQPQTICKRISVAVCQWHFIYRTLTCDYQITFKCYKKIILLLNMAPFKNVKTYNFFKIKFSKSKDKSSFS